mgnify:CR=1 FL=1
MKKTYIRPITYTVNIMIKANLMELSQFSMDVNGSNGDADVVGLHGIHIECKRNERLNIYDAIDQARRDTRDIDLPAVFHRKNSCDWLVTMRLSDWILLYREYHSGVILK